MENIKWGVLGYGMIARESGIPANFRARARRLSMGSTIIVLAFAILHVISAQRPTGPQLNTSAVSDASAYPPLPHTLK